MEKLKFAELGLSAEVLKAVDKMGFEEASPIQTAVIPLLLSGRDVIGQSSTGSGKTAAFGLPAVEIVESAIRAVQVLILCPTRELAVQVAEEIGKLAFFKRGVREVPVYGGQSYERQIRALQAGAQIVIGTPGRVMDHMERGTLRLDKLKMIVLDECDRMLDMGFRDDIDHILKQAPTPRQLLFFSATMPAQIKSLITRHAQNPEWIKIEAEAMNAPKVDQVYFEVDRRSKIEVLTRLIDLYDFRYGIIFCSTKIMVDELHENLNSRGYATDRLHGDITQTQRTRVMDKFRRRGFEFLVATDVAARGLDVDDLEVVFNFDLPNDAEDYTHRIGRTGRAGREGRAFTFVSGREIYGLQNMVRYGKLKIRRENVPSLDQVEEARENVFFEKLKRILETGNFRKQDRMVDRLLEQGHASTDIVSALITMMHGGGSDPVEAPKPKAVSKSAPKPESTAKPAPVAKSASKSSHEPPEDNRPAFAMNVAAPSQPRAKKNKFQRSPRTGREPGYTTIFLNVGRKQLITPADIVGKVVGVTRLEPGTVGAIDIRQRHSLVDVRTDNFPTVLAKLAGVRVKGETLAPALATAADAAAE